MSPEERYPRAGEMDGKMQLVNMDTIEATLTLTMTLAQWKQLEEQLHAAWPSSELSMKITDLLRRLKIVVEGQAPR